MFQLASVLVLLFATLTPLANCFDTWDKGPDHSAPVNDTEMRATAWVVGAGFVLVMAKLAVLQAVLPDARPCPTPQTATAQPAGRWACSAPTASPPSPSPPPVPLRI